MPDIPHALLLPFQTGCRWINFQQIVRLEGIGNYTICMFAGGSHLMVARTIKCLLNRILTGQFVRLHRKHFVNRAFVANVQPAAYAVDLSNGGQASIARRQMVALMRASA